MKKRVARRKFLKGTGTALIVLSLGNLDFAPSLTYGETPQRALDERGLNDRHCARAVVSKTSAALWSTALIALDTTVQ